MKPLFSCVIPVKGARPFFDEALSSLHAQRMGDDLEIIIQDADVEPDGGQSDGLNKGFAKASGEWLFWLNADDVMLPGVLRRVASLIGRASARDAKSCVWVAGNVVYLNESGSILRCSWSRGWKWPMRKFPVRVGGPSAFFRKELLQKSGGFDVTLRYTMDTDLWERFRQAGFWPVKTPFYVWGFRDWKGSCTSSDLHGIAPAAMYAERNILSARYGDAFSRFRKTLFRLVRLLNGSLIKTWLDTRRLAGRNWKEVGR